MRILLSNDDGIYARGLEVIAQELKKLGELWTVAPVEEQSTKGHSLTLHKPLRTHPMGPKRFGVTGTPADCVCVGIKEIMKKKPDIVVSGINRGANLGQDIFYSGTVSAAREATIWDIPSFAISLDLDPHKPQPESKLHYETAAKIAIQVIKSFQKLDMPKHVLININVPNKPMSQIKGIKVARQGFRHYSGSVLKRLDHRGRDYFWVGGKYLGFQKEEGTDCHWVDRGFATLSPLKLDTTYLMFLRPPAEKWDD